MRKRSSERSKKVENAKTLVRIMARKSRSRTKTINKENED